MTSTRQGINGSAGQELQAITERGREGGEAEGAMFFVCVCVWGGGGGGGQNGLFTSNLMWEWKLKPQPNKEQKLFEGHERNG
jgi:hypothetical protein